MFPGLLWALLAVAIPVIIHLFYFRRFKRVPFSNVRFLREVKEETSTRSRLRNLLVLFLRMLAVAGLVFAFAWPFIPYGKRATALPKVVSVFVDNSFSMSALDKDVPLIEKAKEKAKSVVTAYGDASLFQVLTHDFEGRHQRLVGKDEALTLIDEIQQTPVVHRLSQVIKRQQSALRSVENGRGALYLISDFQKSITDTSRVAVDTAWQVNLVRLQAVRQANVGIDSCWLGTPVPILHQPNRLMVRIRNYNQEQVDEVKLALRLDERLVPQGAVSVPAGGTYVDTLQFVVDRPGWHKMVVTISDYPVRFDDAYQMAFEVATRLPVLTIFESQPDKYLRAALQGMEYLAPTFLPARKLDYASLGRYRLVILQDLRLISSGLASTLKDYVAGGGNLLIFPRADGDLASLNQLLGSLNMAGFNAFDRTPRQVYRIDTRDFLFRDVFDRIPRNMRLPQTKGSFPRREGAGRGAQAILVNRDGTPYLLKKNFGGGHAYVLSAPLSPDYNDLVRNGEIFAPMLFKMAISAGGSQRLAYIVGRDDVLDVPAPPLQSDEVLKLYKGDRAFIPRQRLLGNRLVLHVSDNIKEAGIYRLGKTATDTLALFGFNYDHLESDLTCYTEEALKRLYPAYHVVNRAEVTHLAATIRQQSRGRALWRWGLLIALVALLLESLVLRFWRV